MNRKFRPRTVAVYSVVGAAIVIAVAQIIDFPSSNQDRPRRGADRGRQGFGPGQAPRGGRAGSGFGAALADYPLQKRFDKNGDKKLDADERKAAREYLAREKAEGRGPRRGPGGGRGDRAAEAEPGLKLSTNDVRAYGKEPLYDARVLRTYFLEFEDADWEKEMAEFYRTDAEVPAKLTVDGKAYAEVGVHFHGASSFFTVGEGQKRSLVISMDSVKEKQNLLGFHTLDLLNAHTDPSFLHTVLYCQIAREFLPAARANFARVVINGESWGIYANVEHFNKDLVQAHFPKSKGARWKVPGSPGGQGGLNYLGEESAPYQRIYEIKSKDEPASWAQLIHLCKVLSQAPLDSLEQELKDVLDVDGALRFLALENALINSDGYWIRSSDYNLCQDETGRFHIVPHDTNETMSPPERPRFSTGGDEGPNLHPLTGADNPSKPLLHRLLAVPQLRERYLGYVREIAETWLDWKKLGPIAEEYHALIAAEIKADTRKLYPYEAFEKSLTEDFEEETYRGIHRRMSLKTFADERRAYLLGLPEVAKAPIPSK